MVGGEGSVGEVSRILLWNWQGINLHMGGGELLPLHHFCFLSLLHLLHLLKSFHLRFS